MTTLILTASLVLSMGVTGVAAAEVPVNDSTASAKESGSTLAKYYSTNAAGFGANKTISVDGDLSDWDSSMLIAQGTANDDPRVYRPNSMYEVAVDLYALYGAYDDNNVYLMWEMTNVQDVVAPSDDYPLSQGTLWQTQEFPFFIAVDTGKADTAIGKNGALTTGGTIWNSGMTLENSFNKLISINTKGGNGPWVYGGDSTGLNPVELLDRTTSKVKMDYGQGILSKNVYGIDKAYGEYNNRVPGDVCDDSAAWVDFNTAGHDSASKDFFYELSIPYSELGITKSDVQNNGIGVMLVATMGMSPMDCLPGDPVMTDQADLDDAANSQENNSFEKSDEDHITAPFARIGKAEGPTQPTQATDPTQPSDPTDPTDPTAPTQPTDPVDDVTGQKQVTVKAGDTVTFTVDTTTASKIGAYRITTNYDAAAFTVDGVTTLASSGSGTEVVNSEVAGQVKTAVLAPATPYSAANGVNLQTITLKATQAGTFTISYTIDEMIDDNENDLVVDFKPVNGVTFTENATTGEVPTQPTQPSDPIPSDLTETKKVTVHKGDLVNFWVEVEMPSTINGADGKPMVDENGNTIDAAGWTIDMYYDTAIFAPNKSFAGSKGFAVGSLVDKAIAGDTTATYPGSTGLISGEFKNGEISITEANPDGLGYKGKNTKVVCVQLEAVADGTTSIGYLMRELVDTNLADNVLMDPATHQPVNGLKYALKSSVVCNHTQPTTGVKVFGDIDLELTESETANVYTGSVNLQAGTYSFKINEDGTEMGYSKTFTDTVANIPYSASYKAYTTLTATGGTYTFSFNTTTNKLTVTYKAFEGVAVIGDIALELSPSETENVYIGSIDLQAGSYKFKINEAGTELGFNKTYNDVCEGVKYSSTYKAYSTLVATGGRYTFSYNTAKDMLTIKHKPFGEIVELFGDINVQLVKASKTGTVYTGSARVEAGTYEFRVNDKGVTKCFGYTFEDAVHNATYNASWKNPTIFNATGGIYSVRYDTATSQLSFTHAAPGVGDVRIFGDANVDLVKERGTIYSGTAVLEAGTYEFRVDAFGKTLCNGAEFTNFLGKVDYKENWKSATTFNATGGLYTFKFDSSVNQLTVVYAPIADKVSIFGDIELDLKSTDNVKFTGTVKLAAGQYSFRINDFGTTYCCGITIVESKANVQYATKYKAATVLDAKGGTYSFTYNKSTNQLTIAKVSA